jgi:ABC-type glycerol-3-phosphate transport system substrate-binding protein
MVQYALVAAYTFFASVIAASVLIAATYVSYKDANGVLISTTPAPYSTPLPQTNFTGNSNLATPKPTQRHEKAVCHPTQANSTKDNGGC